MPLRRNEPSLGFLDILFMVERCLDQGNAVLNMQSVIEQDGNHLYSVLMFILVLW